MSSWKRHVFGLCIALGCATAVASIPQGANAEWEPQKPVKFIVMAGKGGGADKAVRLMQSIIAEHDLSSVPFTPINKPGIQQFQKIAECQACGQ